MCSFTANGLTGKTPRKNTGTPTCRTWLVSHVPCYMMGFYTLGETNLSRLQHCVYTCTSELRLVVSVLCSGNSAFATKKNHNIMNNKEQGTKCSFC